MRQLTNLSAIIDIGAGLFFGALGGLIAPVLGFSWGITLIVAVSIAISILLWNALKQSLSHGAMTSLARSFDDSDAEARLKELHDDEKRPLPRYAFAAALVAGTLIGLAFPNAILALIGVEI